MTSERRQWVTQERLRLDAYHYGFAATGVREIDEILSAVACAGKSYHHTEYWSDAPGGEPSYVELIQEAADRAASAIQALKEGQGRPMP